MANTANTYERGNVVRLSGAFADALGVALDPTVVKCQVKTPSGTTTYTYGTDVALVRDSVGHYHLDVDVSASDTYYYRWYSTGTGQAASENFFLVERSEF